MLSYKIYTAVHIIRINLIYGNICPICVQEMCEIMLNTCTIEYQCYSNDRGGIFVLFTTNDIGNRLLI